MWGSHTYFTPLEHLSQRNVRDYIGYLKSLGSDGGIYVCIERVAGFIGGKVGGKHRNLAAAHTTFVLGQSYGMLEMALVCHNVRYIKVLPKVWQSAFSLRKAKGETKSQHKGRMKKYAQMRFLRDSITPQISDASLLALYAKSKVVWK